MTKKAAKLLFFLCVLSATGGCYSATGGDSVDLSGTWKLVPRDDPAARLPAYDDSSDRSIDLPGTWPSLMNANRDLTATVWLRKQFDVPPTLKGKPLVLSLGRIAVADETYINGIHAGSEGSFPPDSGGLRYGYAWQKERHYFIPAESVRAKGANVVAVRVFSHVICGVAGDLRITGHEGWSGAFVVKELGTLLFNQGALILNVILIILFVITLEWRTQWKLILCSICLLVAASCVHLLVLGVPSMEGLARLKASLVLIVLAHYLFLLGVREFLGMPARAIVIASSVLMAGFCALVIAAPVSRAGIGLGDTASLAVIAAFSAGFTWLFIRALVKDPLRYRVLVFAAIPLVISSSHIASLVLTGNIYRLTTSIAVHFPLVLTVVMAFMVIDLKTLRRENAGLTRALLRRNRVINELKRKGAEEGKTVPRERISDLVEFLDENYMDPYDRRELARKFEFNEDYMLQLFKKHTGMTISQYINARRVEAAKQLISETDGTIIDIAYRVGFDNITYFHRIFKNMTGTTPREFRRGGNAPAG